jgi:integrase
VIQDYEHSKKRSLKVTKWRVAKHFSGDVGAIKAADFTTAWAKRYVSARRNEGAQDSTINRELAIIRRGFALAMQEDPPLVSRVPFIPKLDEDNVRQGFLEHDVYLRLREALPPHLKAIFVVAYHVGVRIGELRKIQCPQVDLKAGEIRMYKKQTKGKEARTLPIYGEMRAWLEMQQEDRDQNWPACPFLFHYQGRPIGSHIKGFAQACKAAGVPSLHFHDLRRSAVRNMERAGIPRKTAMEIAGHKTEAIYRRYDIVSQRDFKLAAARMEAYLEAEAASITAKTTANVDKPN